MRRNVSLVAMTFRLKMRQQHSSRCRTVDETNATESQQIFPACQIQFIFIFYLCSDKIHDEFTHLIQLKVRHNRFALKCRRNVISNYCIANTNNKFAMPFFFSSNLFMEILRKATTKTKSLRGWREFTFLSLLLVSIH